MFLFIYYVVKQQKKRIYIYIEFFCFLSCNLRTLKKEWFSVPTIAVRCQLWNIDVSASKKFSKIVVEIEKMYQKYNNRIIVKVKVKIQCRNNNNIIFTWNRLIGVRKKKTLTQFKITYFRKDVRIICLWNCTWTERVRNWFTDL